MAGYEDSKGEVITQYAPTREEMTDRMIALWKRCKKEPHKSYEQETIVMSRQQYEFLKEHFGEKPPYARLPHNNS